ncbi:MAG: hypothetical protein Q8Q33_00860, partial [Chlamydiota bacterium]|nr:hypothetical protein [Chlamydiota bacterium]
KLDMSFVEDDVTLELDLDTFLNILHTIIGLHIKTSEQGGSILIKSTIALSEPDIIDIHFQTLNPSEEAKTVWEYLDQAQSLDEILTIISSTIGIKLSDMQDCVLRLEAQKYQSILSVPIPQIS